MKHRVGDLCKAVILKWSTWAQTTALILQLDRFIPLLSTCYLSSLLLSILSTPYLIYLHWPDRNSALRSWNVLPSSVFPIIQPTALLSCGPFLIGFSTPVLQPIILSCFAYLLLLRFFIISCLTLFYLIFHSYLVIHIWWEGVYRWGKQDMNCHVI